MRHFLSLDDLSRDLLKRLIARAVDIKQAHGQNRIKPVLAGKILVMIFEESSTRTRVSFEVAMRRLGGHAIFLAAQNTQIGRGESPEDSARVLSRMCDAIMIRTAAHDRAMRFAAGATVPVINGLTDRFHPCQLLADLMTWRERRGDMQGKKVAWIGDGNNVCHSYINAARLCKFHLHIACPEDYAPDAEILCKSAGHAVVTHDPFEAAKDADLVVTDVWYSMGDEGEREQRRAAFRNYRVDHQLMALARGEAIFMHCLPAHRGEEVTGDVLEGKQSAVWDEAANRVPAQAALLEFLLTAPAAR